MGMVLTPPIKRPRREPPRPQKYWTLEDYHRAIDNGTFRPDERLELIRGKIVVKLPMKAPHATGISLVQDALQQIVGTGLLLRVQLPVTLPEDSEPEPDFAVVV